MTTTIAARVDGQDWASVAAALDQRGHGLLPGLLSPVECEEAAAWFQDDHRFRSHVVMAKHGFGQGATSTWPIRYPRW